jgi:proline dehydrogenase
LCVETLKIYVVSNIQYVVSKVYLIIEPDRQKFQAHREFGDRRDKVVSSRTYFYEGEDQCDKNMRIFLESIDGVAGIVYLR